jgi:nucleotide-binding universal stress UspA family protein
MALKDLLVCVDPTDGSLSRMRLAADLASRHGSRLTALHAREWSEAQRHERSVAEMGLVTAKQMDRLNRRVEASIDEAMEPARAALDALGRQYGVTTEWRSVAGPASISVPQHARCADLCITGHHANTDAPPDQYSFSEKLLFVTGRPVLFVPLASTTETLGRRIVVAWNSSRPAARAVNDALPLIERAEQTTVVTVDSADFIGKHGGLPAEQIVEHLRRHGASTDLIQLEKVLGWAIADELQNSALELGADLLVAWAFGQPRLWEKILGGVTRDLLDRMSLPIFMSH